MLEQLWKAARKPGAKGAVRGVAPIQSFAEKADRRDEEATLRTQTFMEEEKARLLDRWLDKIVRASGSEVVFFGILAALLIWALLGIRFACALSFGFQIH